MPSARRFGVSIPSQLVTLALPADAVSQVLVTFHAAAAPGPPAPRVTLANQLTR